MTRPPRALPALLTALALILAACQPPAAPGGPATTAGTAADAGAGGGVAGADGVGRGVHVVTSVFALAWVARRVAPGARVELLGAGGQDPHALSLSPGERVAIADADVMVHTGDVGFQPQVEEATTSAGGEVVAVTDVLPDRALRQLPGPAAHRDGTGHDAGSGDRSDGDGGHGHDPDGDGGHGHGAVDPHVWLSPSRLTGVARAIAAAVADAGGGPADALRANATQVAGELTALEGDIGRRLRGCAQRTALVAHEAWGYLLASRGLSQRGVSGAGGHSPASPQRLTELADLIEAHDVPAVFAGPGQERGPAETLAVETGARLLRVDALATTPADAAAWRRRGYPQLLMDQVATFAEGLECRP